MIKWDRSKGRPEPIAALNKIVEREGGEPLVDIREYLPSMPMGRPHVIPYVRQGVAERVARAQASLPHGVYLSLIEGWRPIERQQRICDFMMASAREAFPDRNTASLRRTVCRWVAPTDQKAPPGHCTGAAVDVQLVNVEGDVLDVLSPFDRHQSARTYTLGLSEEAYRNRMMLVEAMLASGFSNCRDEWWHYSYGDAGWAVRLGFGECFYGLVRLDPHLYEGAERLNEESFKDRTNPFLPTPA